MGKAIEYIRLSEYIKGIMHYKELLDDGFPAYRLPTYFSTTTDEYAIICDIDNTLIYSNDIVKFAEEEFERIYLRKFNWNTDFFNKDFWYFFYQMVAYRPVNDNVKKFLSRLAQYDLKNKYGNVYCYLITGKPAFDFFANENFRYALELENSGVKVKDIIMRKFPLNTIYTDIEGNEYNYLTNADYKLFVVKALGVVPVAILDDNIEAHFRFAEEIFEGDNKWSKCHNAKYKNILDIFYLIVMKNISEARIINIAISKEDIMNYKLDRDYIYKFLENYSDVVIESKFLIL
ncbi:MAG: hypothetical protein ABIL45_03440 [candidate division WOR-3 bacterium]